MDIKDIRIYPVEEGSAGQIRAKVSMNIANTLFVYGITLAKDDKGEFYITFPRVRDDKGHYLKNKEDKFIEHYHCFSREVKGRMLEQVINKYNEVMKSREVSVA